MYTCMYTIKYLSADARMQLYICCAKSRQANNLITWNLNCGYVKLHNFGEISDIFLLYGNKWHILLYCTRNGKHLCIYSFSLWATLSRKSVNAQTLLFGRGGVFKQQKYTKNVTKKLYKIIIRRYSVEVAISKLKVNWAFGGTGRVVILPP